jgi:hypothetical protein
MTTGFGLHASFASFVNFAGVGTPTRPQSSIRIVAYSLSREVMLSLRSILREAHYR